MADIKKRLSDLDRTIGAAVRKARHAAGISQAGLAARVGLTFQQIQKYESGANRIASSTLCIIAEACGVTPAWLLAQDSALASPSPTATALSAFDNAPSARDRLIAIIDGVQDLARGLAEDAVYDLTLDVARSSFADLPVAIYLTDRAGFVRYSNEAAAEFAGRSPQVGIDQWCVTWRLWETTGERLPHDQCPMAIALKQDRVVRGAIAVAERPDGERTTFTPYPTPLHDSFGALIAGFNALVPVPLGVHH